MPTQKEIWEAWTPPNTQAECVQLLFEILDKYEVSDNDVAFRPTKISSCRVWDCHRLEKLLPKIRELFEIPPPIDLKKL